MTENSALNSYQPTIDKIRAATATPETRFEDAYKAARRAAFAEEYAAAARRPKPQQERLTAAETAKKYHAPNPYQPTLDRLRKEQR